MLLNHIIIALLWMEYGLLHSVLAGLRVKAFFKKRLGKGFKHYRLGYTLFAFAGLAAIVLFQFTVHSKDVFSPTLFSKIVGAVITVSGFTLMLICIKKYFMSLSGLRSLLQEEVYTELIISGVHRYVRHPLYSGTFLAIWGLFVVFPTWSLLISNAVITIYTLIGIGLEEKKLVMDFGDQYKRYQQQVPKLIPYLDGRKKVV